MNTHKIRWREHARIILAITTRDILEALKNKNILVLLITVALVIVFWGMLPALSGDIEESRLLLHDSGSSSLATTLQNSDAFTLRTYPSEEAMKGALADQDYPMLGLVVPADFDTTLASGGPLELQGYVLNWVSPAEAAQLQNQASAEISRLVGRRVMINLQGNSIFMQPESDGKGVTAAFSMVYALILIGITLIAHLMLEEKRTRTIDALLVSPASAGHVVAGKALTGLFYCTLAGGMVLVANRDLLVHPWLAILTVLLGALFSVSLGLLLGTMIETKGQLTLWASVLLLPLFVAIFLSLIDELVPAPLTLFLKAIPASVIFNLLRTSFAGSIPLAATLLQLTWLLAWAGGVLLGVTWLVRRRDRGPSTASEKWPYQIEPSRDDSISHHLDQTPHEANWTVSPVVTPTEQQAGPSRTARTSGGGHSLRIIWAITAKDIQEAIKNKIILAILLSSAFIVASNALIPAVIGRNEKPAAMIYDEGRSNIVRSLRGNEAFWVDIVNSRQEMEHEVSVSPSTLLGLVIPADFDQITSQGEAVELEGSYVHWADPEVIRQWAAFFEEQLSQASSGDVQINLTGQALYPPARPAGQPHMISLALTIIILTIGLVLASVSLIEEKEAHTLDALLVSPATAGQMIAGKALAGAIFCVVAALLAILLNRYLFIHWGALLLALTGGVLFAVAAGLLVGMLCNNPTTTSAWTALLLLVLMALTIVQTYNNPDWPALVREVLPWLPGSALLNLFSASMAEKIPWGILWANSAALLAATALLFGAVTWLVRRADR